ncbi:MAG: 50S ribosomal protein L23 [Clostridiales bacterium]|jgi:large subunit ribosomal protein L23|nr:50S ribosomal protein L23 [Clostridiales bacterium]
MNEYEIILRPHITEKSMDDVGDGKYTFAVNLKATKIEIKQAVEKIFNVKVLSVNTMRRKGKKRSQRQGNSMAVGYTSNWKKAIVKIDTDPKPVTYKTAGGKIVKSDKKYKTSIEEFGFAE